jgi:hypothetical protein
MFFFCHDARSKTYSVWVALSDGKKLDAKAFINKGVFEASSSSGELQEKDYGFTDSI